MAISSYGRALGEMARESVTGSVKGFASGVKSAAMSEMPGITSAYGMIKDIRSRAGKMDPAQSASVKEQKLGNVISLEMVRQLKSISNNTLNQARFASTQAKNDRFRMMFEEENEREKQLREKKLLKAIESIGKVGNGRQISSGNALIKSLDDKSFIGKVFEKVLGIAGTAAGVGAGVLGARRFINRDRGGPPPNRGGQELLGRDGKVISLPGSGSGGGGSGGSGAGGRGGSGGFGRRALGFLGKGALRAVPILGTAFLVYELVTELLGIFGGSDFSPIKSLTEPLPKNYKTGDLEDYRSSQRRSSSQRRPSSTSNTRAPLSVRQNNPGNLRAAGSTTGFRSFNTPEEGISALHNQLKLYITGKSRHGKRDTIASIISIYAPSSENQTGKYIDFVSAKIGKGPNEKLTLADIPDLARAITQMEGGADALAYFYGGNRGGGGGRGRPPSLTAAASSSARRGLSVSPASSSVTSGTEIAENKKAISVFDAVAAKNAEEANKNLKNIRNSSGTVSKSTIARDRREIQTRRVKTPQEKAQDHFEKSQERFLGTLNKAFTKIFGETLTGALIPSGYGRGVTAQQASRTGFIGEEIGRATGIDRKVSKALTDVFGKEYGRMLAPSVAGLGKAYVNKLGVDLGTSLFANTMGSNEAATAITGQIIGNVAKGNKQMAMEQLLYATTGVPSGPETIAAHYGFRSAAEGIKHIAQHGAATVTNSIQGMTGMAGRPQRLPSMPNQVYGGLRGPTTFGGGLATPGFNPSPQQQKDFGTVGPKVADATIETSKAVVTQNELINEWGEEHSQLEIQNTQTIAAGAEADVRTQIRVGNDLNFQSQQNTNDIVRAIQTAPRGGGGGSGTSIGGSFGGDFASFLGNMAVSAVTSKLTSKIKNPYVKAAANFGLNYMGNNVIMPQIMGSISGAGGGFSLAGIGGTLSNLGSSLMSTLGMGSSATAGLGTSLAIGASNMMGNMGFTAGADFFAGMANQFMGQTASTSLLAGNAGSMAGTAGSFAGKALPYSQAIISLAQGDVKGAAFSAAGTFIGNMILPGLGGVIGGMLGGLLGKKKRRPPPPPEMERGIAILGNNDINQKVTTFTQRNPPKEVEKFLDAFLNVAFNTLKTMELRTGISSRITRVGMYMQLGRHLILKLYEGENENPHEAKHSFDYGNPSKIDAGTVASKMVKDIMSVYKQDRSVTEIEKLADAADSLQRKTFGTLAGGMIRELDALMPQKASGIKTAQNIVSNVSAENIQGMRSSSAASITPTSSGSTATFITPASASSSRSVVSGEQGIVVASSDNSTQDNSTTVNNFSGSLSNSNDPYRMNGSSTGMLATA